MTRGACLRVLAAVAVMAGEAVLATTLVLWTLAPSDAQWYWGGDQNSRQRWNWFERQPDPERPPDYSRAPPPRKVDPKADPRADPKADPKAADTAATTPTMTTPILVLGDSMADWLAYGLEQAYADTPEVGILRRHKTNSGLIRTETRSDPRGEYPDWPQAARDLIATQKPKFVLMMIGINDRRQFREVVQGPPHTTAKPPPAATQPPPNHAPPDAATTEDDKGVGDDKSRTATAPPPPPPPPAATAPVVRNLDFRSDAWAEAYSKRIDDTIAALKTSGVPVFWVGLPPVRGPKTAADITYLNDLYRSRADKAGIIYIDVSEGFVDEEGRYVQYGPDVEGQTRRLRTGDGVYFTQAGARKLAHYVQREIERWLTNRPAPVAVAVPDDPKADTAAPSKTGPQARPLSGPVVPLTAERAIESDDLLGGNGNPPANDATAARVLVQGDTLPAPAGRADDFAWPRRGVAPVDTDPVVANTDLPMTPMVPDRNSPVATASLDQPNGGQAPPNSNMRPVARRTRPTTSPDSQQGIYRPDRRPAPQSAPQSWSFYSLFGGQSWFYRR